MPEKTNTDSLVRALGLRDSLAIVIGSMIGTGIFLKTAVMTQVLNSPMGVLLAWFAAGVLSLLGALTYAELGALFPRAGGGYVYIREGFGQFTGFLAGWISFLIIFPGSIAAYGVASATFFRDAFPVGVPTLPVALGFIAFFSALNCLAVSVGGLVQSLLTGIKIALILALGVGVFMLTPEPQGLRLAEEFPAALSFGAFGTATLAALWAFDGWEAIARVAGEIRNAQKNLPLALVLGILIVFALYAGVNLAYFWALPLSEIVTSNSSAHPEGLPVATKAILPIVGGTGVQLLSAAFVISALGAMNGCILTSARVPYAMAQDGLLFSFLAKVSPHTRVPVRAIWIQTAIASLMAISGTFDQITNYVIFAAWIFYGLTGLTVFVFRRRMPNAHRSFRVPGYPIVPALFVILAGALVINTIIENPFDSLVGVGLIAAAIPLYYFFFRKSQRPLTGSR